MKLKDLKDLQREEQNQMIQSCESIVLKDAINNPNIVIGKVIVFFGNYAGFITEGLCVRTVEYIEQEEKWLVSDIDLSDMFVESFWKHYDKVEFQENFFSMYISEGFLLNK